MLCFFLAEVSLAFTLFNEGDAFNILSTDKPVALGSQIELEFRNVGFCGGRKTGVPGEKPSEQGRESWQNKLGTTRIRDALATHK